MSAAEGGADAAEGYWAFISYSHRDRKWGEWLQDRIERYALPSALVGQETEHGRVPKRLKPVFRDRTELASSSDLGGVIKRALATSRTLIVVCSPHSATSRWVDEEVREFRRLGRGDRILCLIVDGEPHPAGADGGPAGPECLCPSLRWLEDDSGNDVPAEPLFADVRPRGERRRDALLKLIAGILDVPLGKLRDRDRVRRRRRAALSCAALLAMTPAVQPTGAMFRDLGYRTSDPAGVLIAPFESDANHHTFLVIDRRDEDGPAVLATRWTFWAEDAERLADVFMCIEQRGATLVIDPSALHELQQRGTFRMRVLAGSLSSVANARGFVVVTAYAGTHADGAPCSPTRPMEPVPSVLVGRWKIRNTASNFTMTGDVVGLPHDRLPVSAVQGDDIRFESLNPQSLGDSQFIVIGAARTAEGNELGTTEYGPLRARSPSLYGNSVCCNLAFQTREGMTELPRMCVTGAGFFPLGDLQAEAGEVSLIPPSVMIDAPGTLIVACEAARPDGTVAPLGGERSVFAFFDSWP